MHGHGDHARPGRLMCIRGDQYVVHDHGDQCTAWEIDARPHRPICACTEFDVQPWRWRLISSWGYEYVAVKTNDTCHMFVFVLAVSFPLFDGSMNDISA